MQELWQLPLLTDIMLHCRQLAMLVFIAWGTKEVLWTKQPGSEVPHVPPPLPGGPFLRSDSGPTWTTTEETLIHDTDVTFHTLVPANRSAKRNKDNQEWSFVTGQLRMMVGQSFDDSTVKFIHVYKHAAALERFRKCRTEFKAAGKSVEEMYVFHGTPKKEWADSIVKEGFRIGGLELFGRGVYTATDPMEPVKYGKFVVMCRGITGRQKAYEVMDYSHFPADGFDSWMPTSNWCV